MSSASGAGLDARVVVERPSFRLDAELTVEPGSVMAVVGPNGAGKSTLLAAIAGLQPLTEGRIAVAGELVDDTATALHVAAGRRGVATAFQDGILFDGLSVLDNVGFGLRAAGRSRKESRAAAQSLLHQLGLGDRAADRPRSLSGGQAARVSLARALAVEPQLLLLDEPMAALDATARTEIRPWLADILQSRSLTTLLVTHDPHDLDALVDDVVVLDAGAIVDRCPPHLLPQAASTYGRAFAPPAPRPPAPPNRPNRPRGP